MVVDFSAIDVSAFVVVAMDDVSAFVVAAVDDVSALVVVAVVDVSAFVVAAIVDDVLEFAVAAVLAKCRRAAAAPP